MRKILYAFLFVFLLTESGYAWHVNTHLQMTRDAITLMPAEFKATFLEHQKFVESGIKDPDELIRDWQNHYYIAPTKEGGALDRIDKIIPVIQTKFKTSTPSDTSKQLCYLAHYIADLWSPEPLLRKSITTSNMTFTKDSEIVVFYEGHPGPIENIREYLEKRSQWRWKLEDSRQIYTLLYSEALNDIARVWLTLWEQAGKPAVTQSASVLVHRRGALTVNYERLLAEEKYYWYAADGESSWMDAYAAHQKEVERLKESAAPSDEQLAAAAELRNQEEWMSKLNPRAPFRMIETSLKPIEDRAFFVARIMNKGKEEIPSIAFMYPGVKGPVAIVKNLKPGQVAKIQADLPGNANRDQVQLIFATPQ